MHPRTVIALALTLGTVSALTTGPAHATRPEGLAAMIDRNDQCYQGPRREGVMLRSRGAGRSSHAVRAAPPTPKLRAAPTNSAAAPPPMARPPGNVPVLEAEEAERISEVPAGQPPRQTSGPRVDWGGTVHLSNDDSMSLASAQRLLYALDSGARFTLDQIRPHELLNYFTFDQAKVRGGDLFAIQASAETTSSDELSLALAIQGATPDRAPLDLTILVDRSGSMGADGRMDYTKRALHKMADNLVDGDRIDIVLFDDSACAPLENFVVGRDNRAILDRTIERMTPRGSTDLDLGLREAYRIAKGHNEVASRAGRVMAFTDAMLNTGDVNPHTVTEVGKALDEHNIRLTGVGVGRDFRDDVLDMLTEKGKGAYVFLGSERVVDRLFGAGFDALVQTIAMDVRFALDLPPSLGMTKFYGEESSTNAADIQPVNFQAGNSQVFLQDLAIQDGKVRRGETIGLDISWDDPVSGARTSQRFQTTVGQALDADPHNVRKARALMSWTDILYAHAMGADACGDGFDAYRQTLPGLEGDAEIAYVSELIGKWCDFPTPVAGWTAPAFTKVRLDSDQFISDVELTCQGKRMSQALTASDTVAQFDAPSGSCDLTLHGTVPMTTRVDVPATGGDLRCVVRGGRIQCT